jgi:flagellar P-ring protein precursor FlgI
MQADFTTASRVAEEINENLPQGVVAARALDASSVQVTFLPNTDPIGIIAQIEDMNVTPDTSAKIVINERTGTVVLGGDVTISACAIAQGTLTVRISDDQSVSQADPLANNGATVTTTKRSVTVDDSHKTEHVVAIKASPTIDRVVKALNALGVTPRDLISILQAMKQAGALHADVEVQ